MLNNHLWNLDELIKRTSLITKHDKKNIPIRGTLLVFGSGRRLLLLLCLLSVLLIRSLLHLLLDGLSKMKSENR